MNDYHVEEFSSLAEEDDLSSDDGSLEDSSSEIDRNCDTETAEESLEIKVKQVGKGEEDVLCLKVDPKASVLDLKTQISKLLAAKNNGIPVDRQRLMYFGRMLRDNDQILGSDGVKMQTEAVNYVHLSPLPEGAKPSPRNNSGINLFSRTAGSSGSSRSAIPQLESVERSLEQSLERARRIGAAARERRRRRRPQPYDPPPRRTNRTQSSAATGVSSGDAADTEQIQSSGNMTQQPPSQLAFAATSSTGTPGQGNAPHVFPLPAAAVGQTVLGTGLSLLPSLSQLSRPSQLPQLSQLSAAVAAATADASRAATRMNSHLLDQVHHLSSELTPFLPLTQDRLMRISTSNNLVNGDCDFMETANVLDHVSRETSALALALRRLSEAAPAAPVTGASGTNPVNAMAPISLEPVLSEGGETDPAIFLSQGPSILLPGAWFPPMM